MLKQKIILVADSHTKCASFMNWLVSSTKTSSKRVLFAQVSTNDEQSVEYLDLTHNKDKIRVVGVETASLGEPLLIPLMSNATKVVMLISRQTPQQSPDDNIATLAVRHSHLLRHRPKAFCLFAKGCENQKPALQAILADIGIHAAFPDVDTSDFRAIWLAVLDELTAAPACQNAPQNAAISAPAKTVTVTHTTTGETEMSNITESMNALMQIDGAIGCLIADYTSGMVLAKAGGGVNLDVAGAGNSEVIKSKMKTMAALGIKDSIEDMLITLSTQYHLIRPLATKQGLFLYIVLDKAKSNLAMARFKLLDIEKVLSV